MQREARRQRNGIRIRNGILILWPVSIVLWVVGAIRWHWHGSYISLLNCLNMSNVVIMGLLNSKSRKKTLAALVKVEDVRIVGALCDVLAFQNPDMKGMAQEALVNLLPRLQASDSNVLNAEQRGHLYAALKGTHRALVLAILKALEQVGDAKAIPFVEALAAKNDLGATNLEVRRAAKECLPYLRVRRNRSVLPVLCCAPRTDRTTGRRCYALPHPLPRLRRSSCFGRRSRKRGARQTARAVFRGNADKAIGSKEKGTPS